jgi:hypothetical protein
MSVANGRPDRQVALLTMVSRRKEEVWQTATIVGRRNFR